MKFLLILIVVKILLIQQSHAEYEGKNIKVMFPKSFDAKNDFNLVVQATRLNASAYVLAEFMGEKESEKIVCGEDKLTVVPIQSNMTGNKEEILRLTFYRDHKCSSHEVKIKRYTKTVYTLIQLDKPYYEPGDKIKYRAITLDNYIKPFQAANVKVTLTNPHGTIVSEHITNSTGVVENYFDLDSKAEEGNYTLKIVINNHEYSPVTKIFSIKKILKQLYDVKITTFKHITLFEDEVAVTVEATNSFNKYFEGNATVEIFDIVNSTEQMLKASATKFIEVLETFEFSLKKNLHIKQLRTDPQMFQVRVTFNDTFGSSIVKTKEIFIHKTVNCNIKVLNLQPYVPNAPIKLDVLIENFRGGMISVSEVPVIVTWNNDRRSIKYSRSIKNGIASFTIRDLNKNIEQLNISYGSRCSTSVKLFANTTMQDRLYIDFTPERPTHSETVLVNVHSPKKLLRVFYIASNRFGILKIDYEPCYYKLKCKLYIKTTRDMSPQTTVNIYGVVAKSDELIEGKIVLDLDQHTKNFVNVLVNVLIDNAKILPGRNVSLSIKSKPQSDVYLFAIDKQAFHTATENFDLNFNLISSLYSEDQSLGIINEDFSNATDCTPEEDKIFADVIDEISRRYIAQTFVRKRSTSLLNSQDNGETNFLNPKNNSKVEVKSSQDVVIVDIPTELSESWLFEKIEMKKDNTFDIRRQVPDSMTSWVISAFSIHKDFGFALAPKRELNVSRSFYVNINLPPVNRVGEVVKVEVLTMNFIRSRGMDVKVTLKVEQLDSSKDQNDIKFCESNQKEQERYLTFNSIEGKKLNFQVCTSKEGNFKVTALVYGQVNGRFYADAEEKILRIEPEQHGELIVNSVDS